MEKLSRLLVVALIVVSVCCGGLVRASSGGTVKAQVAAPSPEFLSYVAEGVQQAGAATTGLIPSPVDWSYLDGQHVYWPDSDAAIPSSYDLRNEGRVTAVRNQGSSNSCWAFATYGSLESTTLPGQTLDLSENNLKNTAGFDYLPNGGGNAQMAAAYLARWSGPIAEADDPYDPTSTASTPNLSLVGHVQNILMLPQRSGPLDTADIKRAIMDYGALYEEMLWTDSSYNAKTSAYLYAGSGDSNHEIAVVGWDDSFPASSFSTTAVGNGAWIIKNSWGASWGMSGYFYISYYDSVLFKRSPAYCFQKAEPTSNYTRVYQYDPLGETAHMSWGSLTTGWSGNKFVAVTGEAVRAVGFYTTAADTSYDVRVYGGWSSPQFTGLLSTQVGVATAPGYHTVVLSSPASVVAGQTFGVVVKVQAASGTAPISIESPIEGYASKARAWAGQSYVSSDGSSWVDLTSIYFNTNVCVKAYAGIPGRTWTITPSYGAGGTIVPGTAQSVFESTDRTFTMVPDPGYHLADVVVDGISVGAGASSYTFTNVQSDHTIRATFAPSVYQIILTWPTNGTVSKTPDKRTYSYNDAVIIKATPAPGYHFAGWSGDLMGSTNPVTIAVIRNMTISGAFALGGMFTITPSAGAGGTITPSTAQTVVEGSSQSFSIAASVGYHTADVLVDGVSVGTPPTYMFSNVHANHSISAAFAPDAYALTVTSDGNGSVTRSPDQATYAYGTVVQLTATPADGYVFTGWSGDLTGSTNPTTITMTAGKSVTAIFTLIPTYVLTVTSSPSSGGSIARNPAEASYRTGTVVQLTATPADGYVFAGWTGDATGMANPVSITMTADKSVTAIFTLIPTYVLTVTSSPSSGGSIARNPAEASYRTGTVVQLTATPAAGYTFTGWSGDATGTANPVSVTMDEDKSVTASFVIAAPSILTSSPLPAATAGQLYDQHIVAAGGTVPLELTRTAGALPSGLVLAGDGALTGTPSAAGDYSFTVKVTDHAGLHAEKEFTLHVNAPPTGTVQVKATLNGVAWTGPMEFQVTGSALLAGTDVPSAFDAVSIGLWTLSVTGGGPTGATIANIAPAYSQTLAATGVARFTVCYETLDYVGMGGLHITLPLGPDYRGSVLTVQGRAYGTPPAGSLLLVSVHCASTGVDTTILTMVVPTAATDWTASVSAEQLGISGTSDVEIRARLAAFPAYVEVVLPLHWSAAPTFSLVLSPSWNLISVPAPLQVSSISGFKSGFGYHDGWSQLTGESVLAPGEAYWIDVEDAVTIPLFASSPVGPVTLTYQAGWQLLGNPFDVPLPATSITDSTLITACYSYGPQWTSVDVATGVLEPGNGYWIQLSAPTTLTLTRP